MLEKFSRLLVNLRRTRWGVVMRWLVNLLRIHRRDKGSAPVREMFTPHALADRGRAFVPTTMITVMI
jgi:hypothetical protein